MYILTDLDHTISDARWRDHMIPTARNTGDWDEYHKAGSQDMPLPIMIDIVRYFSHMPMYDVIGLTGRNAAWRLSTMIWMKRQGIICREVLMRPEGDRTPSPELKAKLIRDRFEDLSHISIIFEDRDDCIREFKQMGLNVIQFHDSRGDTIEKRETA